MKKDIPGYEGLYAVDEQGTVWSLQTTQSRRAGPLKSYVNTGGYLRVNLYKDRRCRHEYVHRLVATAFIPNPNGFDVVNHIDCDPQNNTVANLEWCSQKENISYSRELGHQKKDAPVKAFSIITGETRIFPSLRNAGRALFGREWALLYHHGHNGDSFPYAGWLFEVQVNG